MNKEFNINKNIYDLEYNHYLNYLNIVLISLITLFIYFLFNFKFQIIADLFNLNYIYNPLIEIEFLIMGFFNTVVSAFIIITIFNHKLDNIKDDIRKLTNVHNLDRDEDNLKNHKSYK